LQTLIIFPLLGRFTIIAPHEKIIVMGEDVYYEIEPTPTLGITLLEIKEYERLLGQQ
jgi:hypothetical protein